MDDEIERRLARNEALFREVNDSIARGLWPGEEDAPVRFRCECAQLDCNGVITLTAAQYAALRRRARHFVVVPGHELPEVESVVERHERYLVVEKRKAAGAEAEQLSS